jgi:hypothetical protein
VLKNWKLGIVLAAVAVLSACGGGGGSDPTPRGAIAVQPANGFGAIGVNYTSQPEANSRAIDDCGGASKCIVALEFSGHGTCGSIALDSKGVWGVASSGSKEVADKQAVQSCVDRGGNGCFIPQWLFQQCN